MSLPGIIKVHLSCVFFSLLEDKDDGPENKVKRFLTSNRIISGYLPV